MNHDQYSDSYLKSILEQVKTIAVVGASPKPERASNRVSQFLIDTGYEVIPVNPGQAGNLIAGAMAVASLADIAQPVDMVDVFRNSDAAYGVVEEALALDPLPQIIWMQLGVRNDAAAKLAEAKGVNIVMNRCPKIEHPRLLG